MFGAVYRGTIHGSTVAVKLLSAVSYMYTMHVCLLLIIVQHFIATCITTLCCNLYIKDYINTNFCVFRQLAFGLCNNYAMVCYYVCCINALQVGAEKTTGSTTLPSTSSKLTTIGQLYSEISALGRYFTCNRVISLIHWLYMHVYTRRPN